jgi:hypothetical protein
MSEASGCLHTFSSRSLWSSSGAESEDDEEMDICAGGERDLVVFSFSECAMVICTTRSPSTPLDSFIIVFPTRELAMGCNLADIRSSSAWGVALHLLAFLEFLSVDGNFLFGKTFFFAILRFLLSRTAQPAMDGGAGGVSLEWPPPIQHRPHLRSGSLVFTLIRGAGTL